ncbi:MAPK-interacting and spindle-stabilizing protein-like [Motacilla alba alba]|uniref:MAPK-interacting and spindle-stabilizing protein-like n=1 Tax=Motacilla alba alba TaxID=1094192 RepID=UPI0018D59FEF|nr:MAPK-interacting and spindle-stabilizing protein-like [Motacilla alba alba]
MNFFNVVLIIWTANGSLKARLAAKRCTASRRFTAASSRPRPRERPFPERRVLLALWQRPRDVRLSRPQARPAALSALPPSTIPPSGSRTGSGQQPRLTPGPAPGLPVLARPQGRERGQAPPHAPLRPAAYSPERRPGTGRRRRPQAGVEARRQPWRVSVPKSAGQSGAGRGGWAGAGPPSPHVMPRGSAEGKRRWRRGLREGRRWPGALPAVRGAPCGPGRAPKATWEPARPCRWRGARRAAQGSCS